MSTSDTDLGMFDGRQVITSSIKVTNAGDGLSAAMSIDPQEFHHGQKVYLVIEAECTKVEFVPIKDTDKLARVHTLKAGVSTPVDHDKVKRVLDAQRKALEEAKGVAQFPGMNPADDPLGVDD